MWTWRELPKDGVVGDYLPLSGGTLTGVDPILTLNCTDASPRIVFKQNGTIKGSIRFNDNNQLSVLPKNATAWYEFLHEKNFSNYALPLSGGTLTNTLKVKQAVGLWIQKASTQTSSINVPYIRFGKYTADDTADNTTVNGVLGVNDSKELVFYKGTTSGSWLKVLHEGNYSDYALPLSGGTVIGNIRLQAPGGNNPYTALELAGSNTDVWQISGRFNKNSAAENNKLNIYYYNGSTYNDIMTLQTNGNVGIGTTSPSCKLHVNGYSRLGDIMLEYNDEINRYGDVLYINHRGTIQGSQGTLRTGNIVMCYNGGHVGIGSRQPESPLVVSNKDAAGIEFSYDSAYGNIITYNRSTGKYLPLSLGASIVNVGYSGVTCSLLVTGGITMYSDQRKKTILSHVELSLKQIADAPLIEHYYNSDQNKTTHVGSIAQYWAGLNDWFCKVDNDGFYTMEIQNCALASAISIARHLEKYESKTDKKIRQLKKRISQLENEIELLKKGE